MISLIITVVASLALMLVIQLCGRRSTNPNLTDTSRKRWRLAYVAMVLVSFYALTAWVAYQEFKLLGGWKHLEWYGEVILGVFTNWWVLPCSVALTVLPYAATMRLKASGRRIYRWRVQRPVETNEPPPNMITTVTSVKHIGLANLFLLTLSVPFIALPEEIIFRFLPYYNWAPESLELVLLIAMSILVFTLVHLASDYDFGTLIVMACLPATAFTAAFLIGDIAASVQLHVGLNLVALPFYGGTSDGQAKMKQLLRQLRMIPAGT